MVRIDNERQVLTFEYNGRLHCVPSLWLRDSCRCTKCFYGEGHQRLLEPTSLSKQSSQINSVNQEQGAIEIVWNDNHVSRFDVAWLVANDGFSEAEKADDFSYQIPWTTASLPEIPTFHYDAIVENGSTAHLEAMARYGVFVITGTPTTDKTVLDVSQKLAFSGVRSTNFGEMFDLKVHRHQNMKLAFTNRVISQHNDLLIRRQPPSVTLLHCLSRSGRGGESTVTDGLAVALELRDHHKDYFQVLLRIEVEIEDVNDNWHYLSRKPVIEYRNNRFVGVNYNNWERSPYIRMSADDFPLFHAAYSKFCELSHSPRFCHKHMLESGQIIVVDNTRLMHGREKFDDSEETSRLLQGCHIDVDDLISAYRKSVARNVLQ